MADTNNNAQSMQIVCFKVGGELYGIEILKVQEILKIPKVTTLPKSAPYIKGVINLRGKVLPIVDLGKRFGVNMGADLECSRAIVVDIQGRMVGLAIDAVSQVIKINAGDIEPPPPIVKGISGRYIIGIGKLERGFVIILDIEQIFSTDDLKTM